MGRIRESTLSDEAQRLDQAFQCQLALCAALFKSFSAFRSHFERFQTEQTADFGGKFESLTPLPDMLHVGDCLWCVFPRIKPPKERVKDNCEQGCFGRTLSPQI